VSDFFLDFVGGAQSSIFEQREALVSAGHSVVLVAPARLGRGIRSARTTDGLQLRPLFVVPGESLPIVPASASVVALLTDYFRRESVSVVHVQTEFGLAHAAVTAARALGLPVVNTVHTFYWRSEGIGPTLVSPIMRFGLQLATGVRFGHKRFTGRPSDDLLRNLTIALCARTDAVVSPSAHQAADLETAGVTTPVSVVPNPIARSPRPPSILRATQDPRIVWVARCEPEKRPLDFARAAIAALSRPGIRFAVDFIGSGTELEALKKLAAGHPQLIVHGSLPHEKVIDLIDSASLVALISVGFDNQPMTIAEAVSRFRGVLYCDEKLLEGLTHAGVLSGATVEELAERIASLVSNPDALVALSEGARDDAVTFSGATYVERIMQVYFA
jgi:glycosyltransferase involved in cell wall biosynthesis